MTKRTVAFTPLALIALVLTGATTLTFAAVKSGTSAAKPAPVVKTAKLVAVPDVSGQAYVFAKGILEDAGFAWKVRGGAKGYAVNTVSGQAPAAGTILIDTGAPTVSLTLARNSRYSEVGTPQDSAPYAGTAVRLPSGAAPSAKPKPSVKPKVSVPVKSKPASKPKPVAKPKPANKPAAAAPSSPSSSGSKSSLRRNPAFVAPGAPAEPQNEMPLPDRARLLNAWLDKHQDKTVANVDHFTYQHAWIVYGAKFGWWHGANALELLIKVDRRAESLWGTGPDGETAARDALAIVRRAAAKT